MKTWALLVIGMALATPAFGSDWRADPQTCITLGELNETGAKARNEGMSLTRFLNDSSAIEADSPEDSSLKKLKVDTLIETYDNSLSPSDVKMEVTKTCLAVQHASGYDPGQVEEIPHVNP
jgi:hypothetical protein